MLDVLITKYEPILVAQPTKHKQKQAAYNRFVDGVGWLVERNGINENANGFPLARSVRDVLFGHTNPYAALWDELAFCTHRGNNLDGQGASVYQWRHNFIDYMMNVNEQDIKEQVREQIQIGIQRTHQTFPYSVREFSLPNNTTETFGSLLMIPEENIWTTFGDMSLEQLLRFSKYLTCGMSLPVEYHTIKDRYFTGLQNLPKELRKHLFHGWYDYDVRAAMATILYQHYKKQTGGDLEALGHYVARTTDVRQQIAKETGLSVDDVKVAMNALINGARLPIGGQLLSPSVCKHFRLVHDFGRDKVASIVNSHTITQINEDIMRVKKTTKEPIWQLYFHIERNINNIVSSYTQMKDTLLIHDGFITKDKVNTNILSTLVSHICGYDVIYEVSQI